MEEKSAPTKWSRLAEAAVFATEIHADQVRKGADTPYLGHLLAVAGLVFEYGGDEDQAIAGLLHDAIEDVGPAQEAIIAGRFGPRVAAIVRGCTDTHTKPKPAWRERKEAYVAHLELAGRDILLVSASDKLANARSIVSDLRTIGPAVFDRFTAGQDGTLWYYQALASAFGRLLPGSLSAELAATVATMAELAPMPTADSDGNGLPGSFSPCQAGFSASLPL